MHYLDAGAVARLRAPPAWKQIDRTLVSKVLEPFWASAVKLTPLWVAPNAITLLGFAMVAVSFAIMLAYCPDLDGSPPGFAYAAAIVAIFGFQTLDAMDGKQARRTGSSSPLGNWLDHACDVVALQLAALTAACSLRLGTGWLSLFLVASVLSSSIVVHWETKHTGVLFMGNGTSIHEAQMTLMVIHAVTWIFGQDIWDRSLASLLPEALHRAPLAGAPLRAWLVVGSVGVIGGVGLVGGFVRGGRGLRGRALLSALAELFPVGWLLLMGSLAFWLADPRAATPVLFAVSCLGLRLIGQMVLWHLADIPIRIREPVLAPLTATVVYLAAVRGGLVQPVVGNVPVAWANCAFAAVVTVHYFVGVTREMARALGVPILTLPERSPLPERG